MTKLRVGDIVQVAFLENGIGIVVAHNDDNAICLNWITQIPNKWRYHHTNPDCDIWLSAGSLKIIAHADHI